MSSPSPFSRPRLRGLGVLVVATTALAGAPALAPVAGAQTVPLKDINQPTFSSFAVAQGGTATTLGPGSFYNTDLSDGTVMVRTADTPAWVTINPNNSLTATPGLDVAPGPKRIPVLTKYADGSSEVTFAKFYVYDPAKGVASAQMLAYAPELRANPVSGSGPATLPEPETVPAGTKVTLDTSKVPATVRVVFDPATNQIKVNLLDGAEPGEYEVPLVVQIPGQPDFHDVMRIQADPDQSVRNTPGYPALSVRPGVAATVDQKGDTTMPAGTRAAVDPASVPAGWTATVDAATGKLTVTAPANAADGAKAAVKVVFTYPDRSTDVATAAVVVGAPQGSLAGGSLEGIGGSPLLLLGSLALGVVAIGALIQHIQSLIPALPPLPAPAPGPQIPNGRG